VGAKLKTRGGGTRTSAIKEKKECYKRLFLDRSADNIEKYKVAKKIAK